MRKIITAFMMLLCAVCVVSAANYLTFTAEEDGSTFGIVNIYNNPDVQYSLDGGNTWNALTEGDTVMLVHVGDKALLKGNNPNRFSSQEDAFTRFVMTGKIAASGSVMSLIDNTGETLVVPAAACFCKLFEGCTSLTQAPALPATTLAEFCYLYMFNGCTSLTQAPELPATTLDRVCYAGMFQDCTSLTQAPELPATTLASSCYNLMFRGCTSLTQAPELPATTLLESCYAYMFSGCTSLSEISVVFDEWSGYTQYWVYNVAPTGTFICPKGLPLEYGENRIPEGWTVKYIEDTVAAETNYLTFTAEEDGSSFGIVNKDNNPDLQYSLDGGKTWTALAVGDTVILAHKGDKALLKGNNPEGFSKYWDQYSCFRMTGKVAANGSVMSLIDGLGLSTEIPGEFCFRHLFSDCTSLTQAPELPATTLTGNCYESMFSGCTSLTQAPALPATTLTEKCYDRMFSGCASLTRAPELPATTLAEACYEGMFQECTSLTQAPALPATTLPTVSNVKGGCYIFMFSGCTSLSRIRVSFDDWNDGLLTLGWVKDVAPTGTFICPKALALEYGMDRIPEGWTVKYIDDTVAAETNYLTFTAEEDGSTFGIVNKDNNPDIQYSLDGGETWTALAAGDTITLAHKGDKALLRGDNPEGFSKGYDKYSSFTMTGKIAASGSVMSLIDGTGLSTEIPNSHCFFGLFEYCSGLTQAPELPATTLAEACYSFMFAGCTSLTQAPELPATTLVGLCYNCIFVRCESLSQIRVSFDEWSDAFTGDWVVSVAPTGTFICPKALPLEYGEGRIPDGWTVQYVDDTVAVETNYLTFTAEEDGSTFGIINEGGNNPDVQYSLDGGKTWTALAAGDTITLAHKGDKALLRGDNPEGFSKSRDQYSTFRMTGKVSASGSAMSLIDGIGKTLVVPAGDCFHSLFEGCTSLTQAPELPATTLAEGCYQYMFFGCTSLTEAPELPATTLAEYCYLGMFRGCTSLTQAPELPATTMYFGCYNSMFRGCTSLTEAPELPATTLASCCYYYMFEGCTSLIRAPQISALTMDFRDCIAAMFSGCTNLSEISVAFEEWSSYIAYTREWVADVAPTGTFICPKTLALEYGISWIPEGWTVKYIEDMANYLTFTAEEDSSTFGFVNKYKNNPNVQYSLDGGETWTSLAEGKTVMLALKGDKALLRGDNPKGFSKDWYQYSYFKMTGKVAASGSVMSLIDGTGLSTEIPDSSSLFGLFKDCKSLTQAPELSATTLTKSCYDAMFSGCTSLTQAPALPATTLADYCYMDMFSGCTSLTQAPELPATTLTGYCYYGMFSGCTSLTQAPELPATTLATHCYYLMFSECAGLTQAPELPATTLVEYCYYSMFLDCTGLTQAPELPATTLAKFCYCGMFDGCTSLSLIKVPFVDWFDNEEATSGWVRDVAPTGTFICPKDLPLEYRLNRIPLNWEVQYIEGEGSGVSSALAVNITVWTDDLTIFVRGAEGKVSLYDMSGRRIAVSNSADEERALCVPSKGVYVVRTSGGERSVLVR